MFEIISYTLIAMISINYNPIVFFLACYSYGQGIRRIFFNDVDSIIRYYRFLKIWLEDIKWNCKTRSPTFRSNLDLDSMEVEIWTEHEMFWDIQGRFELDRIEHYRQF